MLASLRSDVTGDPWVPGWIVVVILAREIWVTGVRAIAAERGAIVAAGSSGKLKSALQMIGIPCLLLHDTTIPGTDFDFQFLGLLLLKISIILSYLSAVDYTLDVLEGGRNPSSPFAADSSADSSEK
jgi:CDP-diacylglycerol--glycerol-3-phosphate 3-phosphatidyltransferase